MAKTPAQLQQDAILTDLQTLVTSGVLNSAFADDYQKGNPFDRTWPGFPSVVVAAPRLSQNDFEDQATNNHEYTWTLMCVTTPENLPKNDPAYLSGLVDNVVALFDMDVTLQGTANAGLYPTLLEDPGIINPPGSTSTYVVFFIQFKAKVIVPAGVQ
jgi:hypothetical protein